MHPNEWRSRNGDLEYLCRFFKAGPGDCFIMSLNFVEVVPESVSLPYNIKSAIFTSNIECLTQKLLICLHFLYVVWFGHEQILSYGKTVPWSPAHTQLRWR